MADTLEEELLQAVKFSRSKEVRELLAANKYISKCAALRKAVENGNQEIAVILIIAGANPAGPVFHSLAEMGWTDAVRASFDNISDMHFHTNYALLYAATNGHAEIVEMLLTAGANVREYHNNTLRGAVKNNHLKVVELLTSYYTTKELEEIRSELQSPLLADVIARHMPRGSRTKAALRDPRPVESDI